jgi:hypothetical protein
VRVLTASLSAALLLSVSCGGSPSRHAPADEAGTLQGVVAADDAVRTVAVKMSQAGPSGMAVDRPSFLSAAQAREQAVRAPELKAEFVEGECAS